MHNVEQPNKKLRVDIIWFSTVAFLKSCTDITYTSCGVIRVLSLFRAAYGRFRQIGSIASEVVLQLIIKKLICTVIWFRSLHI